MQSLGKLASWLGRELGFLTLARSGRDVHLLLLTRLVRMFAYGSTTLILALYFAALGHSPTMIGLFMTLTLVGDVMISLVLTLIADGLGRRRILILGALLMTFSGIVFATVSNYWLLLLAAIVGVISPSGNEIGPFRAVEESTIAHLSDAATRSDLFALYVVGGSVGTSIGSLICGWVVERLMTHGWGEIEAYRSIFWAYAAIGLVKAVISLALTSKCEIQDQQHADAIPAAAASQSETGDSSEEREPLLAAGAKSNGSSKPSSKRSWLQLSTASRLVLGQLCGLFFFDSLASGMVPASLIAYFISRKFDISRGSLGTIMAVAQFISSLGNIFASSVSKRIGLVPTMVFTHLPSAIFLALIPIPTALWLTIVLLVARSSLSSMDQAPRSAFLAAIVLPEERTTVMGVVNTVKTTGQSGGPLITGVLAGNGQFWIAFVVAGALKAAYDFAMLGMFASRPLEGDRSAVDPTTNDTAEGGDTARANDTQESSRNGNER